MSKVLVEIVPRVWKRGDQLLTRNSDPGNRVYGENLIHLDGVEYRAWNPQRSKLAAYLRKGGKNLSLGPDRDVLYLGAASGTTASHVAEIVPEGTVFCVEYSSKPFRGLMDLSSRRPNLFPIQGDAARPELYGAMVPEVELVFQDISQRNQVEIFLSNLKRFLRPGGLGILALKSRSVDSAANPKTIFSDTASQLRSGGSRLLETVSLEPFERDHAVFVVSLE